MHTHAHTQLKVQARWRSGPDPHRQPRPHLMTPTPPFAPRWPPAEPSRCRCRHRHPCCCLHARPPPPPPLRCARDTALCACLLQSSPRRSLQLPEGTSKHRGLGTLGVWGCTVRGFHGGGGSRFFLGGVWGSRVFGGVGSTYQYGKAARTQKSRTPPPGIPSPTSPPAPVWPGWPPGPSSSAGMQHRL